MVPTEGFDIYLVCGPLYRCKPTLNGSYFAGRFIEKSDNIEQIGQGLPLSLSKSTRDAPELGFTPATASGGVPRNMAEGTGRSIQDEARRLLASCALFRDLSEDERKGLIARARVRAFSSGDTVFLMGSLGDSMMAVLNGNVRISYPSPEGKEIVLAMMQPGDFFGEIALLDGKARSADAKAVTACSLAVLERRDVLDFLQHHPNAWLGLIRVLCRRLRSLTERTGEVALLDLPSRLAKTLLRLAGLDQDEPQARPPLPINQSQRELGNIVGASRETINKCLREWQRNGVIKSENNLITIKNRAALEKLAEPD
jgi:CRP/FNR family transcriptional regulator, cyclic AMP receptor protein